MKQPFNTGIVTSLERMNNSENGNPRYRVMIGGNSYTTPIDAGWVYAIHRGMIGKQCAYRTAGKTLIDLEVMNSD